VRCAFSLALALLALLQPAAAQQSQTKERTPRAWLLRALCGRGGALAV
jgi:hypothetical protein